MGFKDEILTFEDTKILNEQGAEVMMSWEAPIMEKSAEFICHNSGDVLEIGFGMGICADYIQAQGVNSHTIVEIHPEIIEKLKVWANGKSNVTIVEGDWSSVNGLSTYDGIFYDTWGDDSRNNFTTVLPTLTKPGCRATWWNNFTNTDDVFFIDGTTHEAISVNPVDNMYFNSNTYYLPKKQF